MSNITDNMLAHNRPESILKPIYEEGYSYNAVSDSKRHTFS